MGVDLLGNGGLSLSWVGWRRMLQLAQEFGWTPEGTVEMDYMQLDADFPDKETAARAERAGYFSNDGQLVTDTDAAAIAMALRRALQSPSTPRDVEEFADYCAKGGFRII